MSLLLLFAGGQRIVSEYVDDAGTSDTLRITIRRRYADDAGVSDPLRVGLLRRLRLSDDAGVSDALSMMRDYRRRLTDDVGSSDDGRVNGGLLFPGLFDGLPGAELGQDTVLIQNAPLIQAGRYDNADRNWPDAVFTTVPRCSLQPVSAEEQTADREFASTHMRLFCPPDTPITAVSRVVYAGTTYEVDGEPGRWRDLDGRPSHIEVSLKRLTG